VFNECVDKYLKRIIDIFINNNNKNPKYILLIGAKLNSKLSKILNQPTINSSVIGNYTYTRKKVGKTKEIKKYDTQGNVVFISPLPLPSGANNACSNITINKTVINW
jgi:hypothetical protein